MNYFYKIKKYDGAFKIKRKYYYFPKLELSCKKYCKIFQYQHAIIAELVTGGYDFYLPTTKYSITSHEYLVINHPFTLVASNISEYLTYHDIFVFKKNSDLIFLSLHNFELELEFNADNSLEKRLSELPKITCSTNTTLSFKPEFETLYHNPYDNREHLAVFHADKDYLINVTDYSVPLYESGIQINCLGIATLLPGGDGRFFKASYDEGESWYHGSYFDGITYGTIQPMKENEYSSIYPSKDFFGYWKKNHKGFILAVEFLSNKNSKSFSFRLPCPAKEVQIVKTINRVDLSDGSDRVEPATLWKITAVNDENSFVLVSGDSYVTISIGDFSN